MPQSMIIHTIKRGDTVTSIAAEYGVTPLEIVVANNLPTVLDYTLIEGASLLIPVYVDEEIPDYVPDYAGPPSEDHSEFDPYKFVRRVLQAEYGEGLSDEELEARFQEELIAGIAQYAPYLGFSRKTNRHSYVVRGAIRTNHLAKPGNRSKRCSS